MPGGFSNPARGTDVGRATASYNLRVWKWVVGQALAPACRAAPGPLRRGHRDALPGGFPGGRFRTGPWCSGGMPDTRSASAAEEEQNCVEGLSYGTAFRAERQGGEA